MTLHPSAIYTATVGPHVYRFVVRDAQPGKSLIGGEMFNLLTGEVHREGSFVLDGNQALPGWRLVKECVVEKECNVVQLEFRRRA